MAEADKTATAPSPAPAPVLDTTTPEFQAALKAALSLAIPQALATAKTEFMADALQIVAKAQNADPSQMQGVISDLALAVANMADTGNNRKKIAPAEAKRRVEARERMGDLLTKVHNSHDLRPQYELMAPVWLEGQLVEAFRPDGESKWQRNVIIWRGPPNKAMRPMNDIAQKIYAAYLESVGGSTKNETGQPEQPIWLAYGGLQIVGGTGNQGAANRGMVIPPAEPMELGRATPGDTGQLTSTDDPNADRIPMLGKTFPPAQRTAPGNLPPSVRPQ